MGDVAEFALMRLAAGVKGPLAVDGTNVIVWGNCVGVEMAPKIAVRATRSDVFAHSSRRALFPSCIWLAPPTMNCTPFPPGVQAVGPESLAAGNAPPTDQFDDVGPPMTATPLGIDQM